MIPKGTTINEGPCIKPSSKIIGLSPVRTFIGLALVKMATALWKHWRSRHSARGSGDVFWLWLGDFAHQEIFGILQVFQDLWVGGFREPKKYVNRVTEDITVTYCWWKQSKNHLGCRNKRINCLSSGAGFLPATVSPKRSLWRMNCQGFQAFFWGEAVSQYNGTLPKSLKNDGWKTTFLCNFSGAMLTVNLPEGTVLLPK